MLKVQSSTAENAILSQIGVMSGGVTHPVIQQLFTKALHLAVQSSTFWSDSTIVLHWINTPPHSLKPFVANRVTEILQSSNVTQWRHVPSKDNTADILSRGVDMEDLVRHNMWYRGPHWLTQAETT